jgi:hypothetical protein
MGSGLTCGRNQFTIFFQDCFADWCWLGKTMLIDGHEKKIKLLRADWSIPYQRLSRKTLESALKNVSGYADWRRFDPGPQAPIDERYAALPALTKGDLREHFPAGFMSRGRDLEKGISSGVVEFARTSGSTDDQVTLVFNQ